MPVGRDYENATGCLVRTFNWFISRKTKITCQLSKSELGRRQISVSQEATVTADATEYRHEECDNAESIPRRFGGK